MSKKKKIGLCFHISLTTPYSIVNTNGRNYVCSEEVNRRALPMTVANSRKVQIFQSNFCRCFIINLLMQHNVSLCNSNWQMLENMRIKLNNNHAPSCTFKIPLVIRGTGLHKHHGEAENPKCTWNRDIEVLFGSLRTYDG